MTTATTELHTQTDVQRSALAVTPGSAFRVKTGTVQLFIVCHTPFIHVAASLPSYHYREPIGCEWERRCAQWVCDQFNALEDKSSVTEHDVRNMLHESKRRVPYSRNRKDEPGPAAPDSNP